MIPFIAGDTANLVAMVVGYIFIYLSLTLGLALFVKLIFIRLLWVANEIRIMAGDAEKVLRIWRWKRMLRKDRKNPNYNERWR